MTIAQLLFSPTAGKLCDKDLSIRGVLSTDDGSAQPKLDFIFIWLGEKPRDG